VSDGPISGLRTKVAQDFRSRVQGAHRRQHLHAAGENPYQYDILLTEKSVRRYFERPLLGVCGWPWGWFRDANLGTECAIFEAVHGSAPDIAGKDLANPTALLQSAV